MTLLATTPYMTINLNHLSVKAPSPPKPSKKERPPEAALVGADVSEDAPTSDDSATEESSYEVHEDDRDGTWNYARPVAKRRAPTSIKTEASKEKRSTKSKCPPGLRSGKWTPEEEAFTNKMIHYFRLGLLDIEDGTSLRWYLSKKLNCEAMRVTKKLKGNSSIGKQIFRALDNNAQTASTISEAIAELRVLEEEFVSSLAFRPSPPADKKASATFGPSNKRPKRSLKHLTVGVQDGAAALNAAVESIEAIKSESVSDDTFVKLEAAESDLATSPRPKRSRSTASAVPEATGAELLLHFSLTAHRGEKRQRDDAGLDANSRPIHDNPL
ncbi:hypothetical protein ACHHYP_03112 [Achlya hypogyna]|uniref:Uncharacterized protein n=1 Tax=Achlya hypogyna TaxID=1202772 RepID=A0A1V9Z4M7_ACHHY|nr:hypothetical protein ACHHYP_03112 [Achlya hypogyna]